MEVILAKSAGFCFGVKRAVDRVYEQIDAAARKAAQEAKQQEEEDHGGERD